MEITVPGLRLVPKDKEADIIWVARVGPAVLVNIPGDGKVYMNNLKLAHTSISVPVKDETNQKMNDMILHAFAADLQDKTHSDDKDPNASFAKCLDTHDKMNTLIYVKRGRIEITVDLSYLGLHPQSELHPAPRRRPPARSRAGGGIFGQVRGSGHQGKVD